MQPFRPLVLCTEGLRPRAIYLGDFPKVGIDLGLEPGYSIQRWRAGHAPGKHPPRDPPSTTLCVVSVSLAEPGTLDIVPCPLPHPVETQVFGQRAGGACGAPSRALPRLC